MKNKLIVTSPLTGKQIAELDVDTEATLNDMVDRAVIVQADFKKESRHAREELLIKLSSALLTYRDKLTDIITEDAGKSTKDSLAEVDGSITVIKKTIDNSTLPLAEGMKCLKERVPVGVIGLITSFNFPLAVAFWSIAPAILAGNAVVWKPSKSAPLVALEIKKIFDLIVEDKYKDLLQVLVSERGLGNKLVAHEHIDMISATGSVEMGESINRTLSRKINNEIKPVLELGGNNGVVISEKMSLEHLSFSINAVMTSLFGSNGQRCTNTRRVFVHRSHYNFVTDMMEIKINNMLKTDIVAAINTKTWNEYGYSALIDVDAFNRFEKTICEASIQGGKVKFGNRLPTAENVYVVEPALALMQHQTSTMFNECFAPLLFVTPYDTLDEAIALINAPDNAGLVSGIFTQSQEEVDVFSRRIDSGHIVVNPARGTGAPAYGMGFGGNKDSGEGEIRSDIDPLLPFTRVGAVRRIAVNASIEMNL